MTEKQTHTPGPWEAYNINGGRILKTWRVQSPSTPICTLAETPVGDNEVANAHLIAAAPDLLAALKATLAVAEAYYRTLLDDGPAQDFMMTTVIEPARAAIAKAEGGAE